MNNALMPQWWVYSILERQTGCSGCPTILSPFTVHTHACMNSIMSRKSQSTRDVFLSPLCKWIWKGRKWTFSWHRYAGLIVPQMSVQVMWGGGGKRFSSTFLCCIIVHWATSHSPPIFHKGHFTNNNTWALQCTLNHQSALQGSSIQRTL